MPRLQLEIQITPDETLPGARTARAVKLSGCRTTLKPGEDPLPVIESMLAAYFGALAEYDGELERVLEELGGDPAADPIELDIVIHHATNLARAS